MGAVGPSRNPFGFKASNSQPLGVFMATAMIGLSGSRGAFSKLRHYLPSPLQPLPERHGDLRSEPRVRTASCISPFRKQSKPCAQFWNLSRVSETGNQSLLNGEHPRIPTTNLLGIE